MCHVHGMDLGNDPAIVQELERDRMGRRTGPRTATDRHLRGGGILLHLILSTASEKNSVVKKNTFLLVCKAKKSVTKYGVAA